MKPNTMALGFYDKSIPVSSLSTLKVRLLKKPKLVRSLIRDTSLEKFETVNAELPLLRTSVSGCGWEELTGVMSDISLVFIVLSLVGFSGLSSNPSYSTLDLSTGRGGVG